MPASFSKSRVFWFLGQWPHKITSWSYGWCFSSNGVLGSQLGQWTIKCYMKSHSGYWWESQRKNARDSVVQYSTNIQLYTASQNGWVRGRDGPLLDLWKRSSIIDSLYSLRLVHKPSSKWLLESNFGGSTHVNFSTELLESLAAVMECISFQKVINHLGLDLDKSIRCPSWLQATRPLFWLNREHSNIPTKITTSRE